MIFFRSVPGAKKPRNLSLASHLNCLIFASFFAPLAAIRRPIPHPLTIRSKGRVLIISTGGIGDSLLDSTAIRAMALSFPDLEIHVLAHHKRPEMALHNPFCSHVHLFRKGPVAFLTLLAKFQSLRPWDAILYLTTHDPEARCLGYLLNPHATIGLAWRSEMAGLCAHDLDSPQLRKSHLALQALAVARAAGAAPTEPRMVYKVSESDRLALQSKFITHNLPLPSGQPPIVFQLGGGGSPYRDWPANHFARLIPLLKQQLPQTQPLILLGGPDHIQKAQQILDHLPNLPLINLTGKLTLPESAALLESARCLITTDTGIMHLAFAIGTPTVALLHPSPGPARVGPLVDTSLHQLVCLPKPPGYRRPQDASMAQIAPETVLHHTLLILSRKPQ